jgi:hypothetical protein
MQIGTTARHSPIGLFRCVSYLVHLVRDTGWRRPVGRDHQHSTLVVVVLDGEATRGDSRPVRVGLLPKVSGATVAHYWAPRAGGPDTRRPRLVCRRPDTAIWAGSPAASSPTAARAIPPLDPVFVALNPGALPARERSPAELYAWVRREEQYAVLGAGVVVELYSESHARQPNLGLGDHPPRPARAPSQQRSPSPRGAPPGRPCQPQRPLPLSATKSRSGR